MILAIDIGGSLIKAGLVQDNKILKKIVQNTTKTKNEFIKQLYNIIHELKDRKKISKICIGCPGPLDLEKGKVLNPPNLALKNFPIVNHLKKKFRVLVYLENDARCAGLAIKKFGIAKNYNNVVILTLGTGIGCALFINGKVYHGGIKDKGQAVEIGSMIIDAKKNLNFEQLASGTALKKLARQKLGKEYLARELYELNSEKANQIFKEIGFYLGIGLANIINIFDPEIIVLTGGLVSDIPENCILLREAKKIAYQRAVVKSRSPIEINRLKNAGILGASLLPIRLSYDY